MRTSLKSPPLPPFPVPNAHFSWNVLLMIYFQVLDLLISLYLGWYFYTSRTRRAYLNAVSTTWSQAGKCKSSTVFERTKKLVSLWHIFPLGGGGGAYFGEKLFLLLLFLQTRFSRSPLCVFLPPPPRPSPPQHPLSLPPSLPPSLAPTFPPHPQSPSPCVFPFLYSL